MKFNDILKDLDIDEFTSISSENIEFSKESIFRIFPKNLAEVLWGKKTVNKYVVTKITDRNYIQCCWRSILDICLLKGFYDLGIKVYPYCFPDISREYSWNINVLLYFKNCNGDRITVRDMFHICKDKAVTRWGHKHIDQVKESLGIIIRGYEEEHNINLLEDWKIVESKEQYVFYDTKYESSSGIFIPQYNSDKNIIKFVMDKAREAENMTREEKGVYSVGEGWVSETTLYYEIKEFLPDTKIIQHGKPKWLGQQHLDIYIPELKVAVEYQGAQHDKPIQFFGGQESFKAAQKRDAMKKYLCTMNGIKLIEVREGYNLKTLIKEIKNT